MKRGINNLKRSLLLAGIFPLAMLVSCSKDKTPSNQIKSTDTTTVSSNNGTIVNSDFEDNGSATATPKGWSTSGTSAASYTQSGGYTGKFCLTQFSASAYKVYTYQSISGLPNGYYTLTAWVENSGGQNFTYLNAKNYGGGPEMMTSLPVSSSWTQVTVRGIHVTNGNITIGLNTDANAGNWSKMDDLQLVQDGIAYNFLKGGDVSELDYIESKGGTFSDSGKVEDCFQILKNHGINIVRLRLYNDPGNPAYSPSNLLPAGFQNPADILNLAKRAKAAGMKILLTFHYSDYWTNGSTQTLPHDWANLSYADLKTAVYNFTLNFMTQMQAQGTTPDYVALGNETASGFLFPYGSYTNFNQMAELFNEGYAAVKAVSSSTQVIIHLDDAGNASKYDWFFPALIAAGGKFDIIGASYYPFYTGKTVAQIQSWANAETAKYSKPILIMETGYNWNPTLQSGSTGQLTDNGPYNNIYPSSPAGQRDFLYECFNGLKGAQNGGIIGDMYWDPVMIATPGVGWELGAPNVVDNTTLFDFSGNALPALSAFKYNN